MQLFDDTNISKLMSSQYKVSEWNEDKIQDIIKTFDLSAANIYFYSKSFEGKLDKAEKWYGTKYSIEDISDSLKEASSASKIEGVHMPE